MTDNPTRPTRPSVKQIWVDTNRLASNQPAILVASDVGEKTEDRGWVDHVVIDGYVEIVWRGDEPVNERPDGVRVWVETTEKVVARDRSGTETVWD